MKVTTSTSGTASVAAVDGRVDSANAKDLDQELAAIVDGGGSRLVVDCSNLRYISSAGLRALLVAIKRTNKEGGGVAMCNVPDHIREVLEVSGFTRLTKVFGTVEEAAASFA